MPLSDFTPDFDPDTTDFTHDFVETGWDPLKAAGTIVDVVAGGPQKRERAAKAERDAAIAQQKAEEARLEIARLSTAGAPGAAASTGPSLGGLVDWLKKPGVGGVPNGVTVAVVAAAGFALWRYTR